MVNIVNCYYDKLPFYSGIKKLFSFLMELKSILPDFLTSVLINLIYRSCANLGSLKAETEIRLLLVYLTRDGERSSLEARKMKQGRREIPQRASLFPS